MFQKKFMNQKTMNPTLDLISLKSSSSKTYKDYHNDNIYDENKKSVRLDDDQAFPQFNLNVSNPFLETDAFNYVDATLTI